MSTPADTTPEESAQPEPPGDGQDAAPEPTAAVPPVPVPSTASAPILPAQSREDTDVGWGDYADRDDNDRLLRDRPPHWDNA
jgi:hypothetical protein